jgi:magnesium-transporting ATPase (P-type)
MEGREVVRPPTTPRRIDGGEPSDVAALCGLGPRQVLEALGSSWEGLAAEDAAARLRRQGPNELPKAHGPGPVMQLLAQLTHFFALMLWAASILAFVGGMPQLGVAIIIVVVINGAFSFVQEYRAERAIHALTALLPDLVTIRRDGRRAQVPSGELVVGDLMLLMEGDRIPADARLVRSDGLKVDMSTMTGESEPLERYAAATAVPTDPLEATNIVFAGTYVASGSGLAVVALTGSKTRLGGISTLTGQVVRRPTPLRRDLDRAVRLISAMAIIAGLAFFGASLARGTPARDGFLFAIGVIVALVPEGLLPTLTLSLAMSATRMADRGALVRHLEAVETLGSTTVICSDKTGTMTTNQMTARSVAMAGHRFDVTGSGYEPGGTILSGGHPLGPRIREHLLPVLRATALCGDARVVQRNGHWVCSGDPTEGALVVLARKGGVPREEAERSAPRMREFPFESVRRRMTTVHALPGGRFWVVVKGSPEAVLEACSAVRHGVRTVALGPEEEMRVFDDVEELAADGLRVLAFASRETDRMPETADEAERDLELLGLVGMADPIRAEVPDAIRRCRHAGIRVVMVTGDHPATAASIARKAGIPVERIALGPELPAGPDALAEMLEDRSITVIARVAPEQKLRIAEAFQALGEVVAMTGDGVNDAPALRRSDIGVAMGVAGTDVAREAADLVLLDDNFVHIVEAVEEGRAAFDNIRRFLTYHLTDNVAELAPFVAWALTAGRIPLVITVLQVLALDIGTDLLPALALGAQRPEADAMDRPPRARSARLLSANVVGRAFGFLGPVEALLSLAMLPIGAALFFGWAPGTPLPSGGTELATLSGMVFAAIVVMQMANALECQGTPASLVAIRPFGNHLLVGAIVAEGAVLLCFLYVPALAAALRQQGLSWLQWLPVLVTPVAFLAAEETRKAIVRRRARRIGPPRPRAGTPRRSA